LDQVESVVKQSANVSPAAFLRSMSTVGNRTAPSGTQPAAAGVNWLKNNGSEPGFIPLSFGQQRLWFLEQLEPNSPLYNVSMLAQITGRLDAGALRCALNAILARHEILRTRIV